MAFTRIPGLIGQTLDAAGGAGLPGDESLEAVLEVDAWARQSAAGFIGAKAAAHA